MTLALIRREVDEVHTPPALARARVALPTLATFALGTAL